MPSPYVIYGGELSYFTRKLEAACLFYGLEFEMRNKNQSDPATIEARSGTHQIPVLQTPENWMVGDTTPITRMLDGRYPKRQMYPPGPRGVLVQVVDVHIAGGVIRPHVVAEGARREAVSVESVKPFLSVFQGRRASAHQPPHSGLRLCGVRASSPSEASYLTGTHCTLRPDPPTGRRPRDSAFAAAAISPALALSVLSRASWASSTATSLASRQDSPHVKAQNSRA